jgi:hypothetical protein
MCSDAQRARKGAVTPTEARALEDEAARASVDSSLRNVVDSWLLGHFDRSGRRISLAVWAWLGEHPDYKRIARDHVGPCVVSTVWLGLDHSIDIDSPPVIFETMVFSNDETWHERLGMAIHEDLGIQQRYCTEDQARAGHAEIVAAVAGLVDTIEGLA